MTILDVDISNLVRIIGYPGIFAMIFLESGAFGFFLPGASLLFTAGLLASQGFFDPKILIPLITIAAILGDNVGYWIGNKFGVRLFLRPDSRFLKHEHLARAKRFYDAHGMISITLARFVPIVRTFTPMVAGISNMHYPTFMFYNVLGALLWGAGITTLGYVLGEQIPSIENYLTPIIIGIILVTLIPLAREVYRQWKNRDEI